MMAGSTIIASDPVIVPMQPSTFVLGAKEIIDLMHEAADFTPNLESAFRINCKTVNMARCSRVSQFRWQDNCLTGGYDLHIADNFI
jgi:hypothetical protein